MRFDLHPPGTAHGRARTVGDIIEISGGPVNKRAITTVGIAIVLAAGATSCGGGGGSPYDEDPATSEPMTDEESGPETSYSSLSESPSGSDKTSRGDGYGSDSN